MNERAGLTLDDILRLLSLCLNATSVSFMEQHYQQIQGKAMGSPASMMVADIGKDEGVYRKASAIKGKNFCCVNIA